MIDAALVLTYYFWVVTAVVAEVICGISMIQIERNSKVAC
jgi:hypothetical protein